MIKPSPHIVISSTPVSYSKSMKIQKNWVEKVLESPSISFLWFLEHPPIYTAGISALPSNDSLPFPLIKTDRGGQITYHGPGQQIIYGVISLEYFNKNIRDYVWFLEEWVIQSLIICGIVGIRHKAGIGVWVEIKGEVHKIASLGIKVKKGVAYHGVAINVNPNLSHFEAITPCGLKGVQMTSIEKLGEIPGSEKFHRSLKTCFFSTYDDYNANNML